MQPKVYGKPSQPEHLGQDADYVPVLRFLG